ncbi:MAG: TolC family protein [Planctomycetota bacterium]
MRQRIAEVRRRDLCLFSLLALLFLVGCAGIATREEKAARKDLETARAVYRPPTRTPAALPALSADSSLRDLIEYALLNNPSVEATFYDWQAAVETITTARSLPDPMLSLNVEVMRGLASLTPSLMTSPGAMWPGPGKLSLRADAAYAQALAKRASFENELLATALRVKQAYYQMWVLEEEIRRTREILALLDELERLARERLSVGAVTQQDVLRAQMERDEIRNRLANLEDSQRPLEARLRSALGLAPAHDLPPFIVRLEAAPGDLTEDSLLETAFARNPQLNRMRAEVLEAVALYQLARKTAVPDFSLGLGLGATGTPVPLMPSVGVTLPIWRDKIAAEIARGRSDLDSARARLSAEELNLAIQFAEMTFSWREADRGVRLYRDQLLPKAQASLESARAGYTAGISSFLDLLDAERTFLNYHIEHATAAGRREMTLAEISLLILGRWPQAVPAILPPQQEQPSSEEAPPAPAQRS